LHAVSVMTSQSGMTLQSLKILVTFMLLRKVPQTDVYGTISFLHSTIS